jgi:hypothetical protein
LRLLYPAGDHIPQYFRIPLYECAPNTFLSYKKVSLSNIDKDGEAAADEESVAQQNDEVAVEATEEE